MKIATFDTLIPDVVAVQPHMAWMLATVPDLIADLDRRKQVWKTLKDLNLKFALLEGRIIELETNALPLDDELTVVLVTDGDLTLSPLPVDPDTSAKIMVFSSDTVTSKRMAEEGLREALAEAIVARGEAELEAGLEAGIDAALEATLEKEKRFAERYGGSTETACKRVNQKLDDAAATDAVQRFVKAYNMVPDPREPCAEYRPGMGPVNTDPDNQAYSDLDIDPECCRPCAKYCPVHACQRPIDPIDPFDEIPVS